MSEVVNPVKHLRKNVLNLTMEELCRACKVSKTLIIKNEQGCYPSPSAVLTLFFRRHVEYFDEQHFNDQYSLFQYHTRRLSYGLLLPNFPLQEYLNRLPVGAEPNTQISNEPFYHPFEYWRMCSIKQPNLYQISKAFCTHQGILFKFENQHHLVNSVPDPLVSALLDAGYSRDTLIQLDLAYREFKQYMRNLNLRVSEGTTREGKVLPLKQRVHEESADGRTTSTA